MKKKLTTVAFKGTPELESKLRELIAKYKGTRGAIMPVLRQAQEIYGYLPVEVMDIIAKGLEVPMEEIYGVASFYSQFSLNPNGDVTIAVCLGTACYVKGSGDLINKISEIIGIESGECIRVCPYGAKKATHDMDARCSARSILLHGNSRNRVLPLCSIIALSIIIIPFIYIFFCLSMNK